MQYCSAKGYKVVDTLSDVASSIETNRRGLLKLFDYVINRKVDVIIVTYKIDSQGFALSILSISLNNLILG